MEILHTTPSQRQGKPENAPAPVPSQPEDPDRKLASYMTHELRAPLTSIRSALGILLMQIGERLNPEERQILHMAVRNSERLDSLINDIMDFSKIRAGKLTLDAAPVDPRELIQEAIESLRSWATAKGVRVVRVETDEPAPMVCADRKRTVQVLINLLSNAIKFTPAGGKVEVSAVLGRFDHTGAVMFKVKDTGPGIPGADLERVFRSFEQSALGQKTSSGTGLGLTLAKAMVELQGGRIWAESWRGLGATFLFTLPIYTGETQPVKLYPEPVHYHGLLTALYKRLNSVVAALFA
ncbi:MAG: HAMP domain-containing sensor histidine kinase [Elusimicrobiota bacterium]